MKIILYGFVTTILINFLIWTTLAYKKEITNYIYPPLVKIKYEGLMSWEDRRDSVKPGQYFFIIKDEKTKEVKEIICHKKDIKIFEDVLEGQAAYISYEQGWDKWNWELHIPEKK